MELGKFAQRATWILGITVAGLLATTSAQANMVLDNAIITFEPDKPNRQDITIQNRGNETMYVQVTPYRIDDTSTTPASRSAITNPKEGGLLVSPNKLAIPANGSKLIRLINLDKNREQEGVYRVEVKPVSGAVTGKQSGLKVQIGYEVLVLALPKSPNPQLQASRSGDNLTIKNTGNAHVLLSGGQQCPPNANDKQECLPLTSKRMYPNNSSTYLLNHGWKASFQTATGSQHSTKEFD